VVVVAKGRAAAAEINFETLTGQQNGRRGSRNGRPESRRSLFLRNVVPHSAVNLFVDPLGTARRGCMPLVMASFRLRLHASQQDAIDSSEYG
jgi:hypothetical protein